MRFTFRKKYFTFWHYRRTPSYTASNRTRMADDKATYLNNLERWLNYDDTSSSPSLAEGVAPPAPKPAESKPRKRVDSFVETERKKIAYQVDAENQRNGAARSKRVADLGKVSRMQIVAPLPSCAQEDGDEEWADGEEIREANAAQVRTVAQMVKDMLGL